LAFCVSVFITCWGSRVWIRISTDSRLNLHNIRVLSCYFRQANQKEMARFAQLVVEDLFLRPRINRYSPSSYLLLSGLLSPRLSVSQSASVGDFLLAPVRPIEKITLWECLLYLTSGYEDKLSLNKEDPPIELLASMYVYLSS